MGSRAPLPLFSPSIVPQAPSARVEAAVVCPPANNPAPSLPGGACPHSGFAVLEALPVDVLAILQNSSKVALIVKRFPDTSLNSN